MTRVARAIATVGGIGRAPEAPGTLAALVSIPAAWGLHALGGFPGLAIATLLALVAGLWACARHIAATGVQDPSEVVIDEVVGMWLTLWPLSLGLWLRDMPGHVFPWPGWVAGFVLFRFFDILKPPPVNWAERIPGAWGVMLDDIVAAVLAALVTMAGAIVYHGFFL